MRSIADSDDPTRVVKRLAELESKWGKREHVSNIGLTYLDDIDGLEPDIEDVPGTLRCFICHCIVDRINATHGSGRPRKVTKVEVIEDSYGIKRLEEKISHVVDKLVACPDHVLQLPNMKFPDTDG